MKKRLYLYFHRRTHSVLLARVLGEAAYAAFEWAYLVKCLFVHRAMVGQDYGQALNRVSQEHPKPNSPHTITNPQIDRSLDLCIVIPVFNSETYLSDCIDSVLAQQTGYRYEVIVVDDGSTDGSREILQRYEGAGQIRLVHQENSGTAKARNGGIDQSNGQYIMFVDSDDLVDTSIVEELLNEAYATGNDIAACGYYTFGSLADKHLFIDRQIDIRVNDRDLIMNYDGFAHGKVYKRELFNAVRFPEGYWFEDTLTHFITFRLCSSFSYHPRALYGYRTNEKGATRTYYQSERCIDAYWIVEYMIDESHRLGIGDDVSLYKTALRHLGALLDERIGSRDTATREAVFAMACELTRRLRPSEKYRFPFMYRQLEKSLLNRDYALWELTSRYF